MEQRELPWHGTRTMLRGYGLEISASTITSSPRYAKRMRNLEGRFGGEVTNSKSSVKEMGLSASNTGPQPHRPFD